MPDVEDVLFPVIKTIADGYYIPCKWPNENGPENEPIWLDIVHIPNGVAKSGWADQKANQGLLNIGVNVPPDSGSTQAYVMDDLLTAFAQGTLLFDTGIKVEIYTPPVKMAVFESGQKSVFPVQIRYRSFEN